MKQGMSARHFDSLLCYVQCTVQYTVQCSIQCTVQCTLNSVHCKVQFLIKIYACGVSMHSLGCNQPASEDQTCKIQPSKAETKIYHYHPYFVQSGLALFAFLAKTGVFFHYSMMIKYWDVLQECTKVAQGAGTGRLRNHSFIYKGNFSHH